MSRNVPSRPTQRPAASQETSTTVAIRLRPLNVREKEGGQSRIWRCVPTHNSVTQTLPDGNPLPDGKGTFFTYDRIFDEDSSTEAVYDGVAKEIVHSVSRGMNGTIFAYGQTSSGKTFTMQGGGSESTPGIVQIATRDLFRLIQEQTDRMFLMRVSYLEIYQEEIRDLLNPENSNMQVREDPRKGVYIDAHEETVGDFESVLKILRTGEKQRHVGCTEMNNRSSRSHTIFRLVVESQQMFDERVHASREEVDQSTLVATLNLVDLAGSESVRHTGATGIRQKEGGMINQSLLTLSRVIQTLTQPGNSHVNYRDSKLTRILQPSLAGNARMAIICCATAAEGFLEETRSTFQFASRAKEIKTRAVVNEVVDDKTQIRRMSKELDALKRMHAEQQKSLAAGGAGAACNGVDGGLVEALRQEKAEQDEKIARLKKLLLNIAPVVDEEGEPVLLPLQFDVTPRFRRGKRSRETWCPGGAGIGIGISIDGITTPRPSRLLKSSNFSSGSIPEEGEDENVQKRRASDGGGESVTGASIAVSTPERRSSEFGIVTGARPSVTATCDGDVEAIASKLEEALAAKMETEEEMKEFVAYTEEVERVLASTKALLAKEAKAAREAVDSAAEARAAADAVALREEQLTAALRERIAALEANKADLEEQEAVLRAENEEAAAIIAENQARVPTVADVHAQTDVVGGGLNADDELNPTSLQGEGAMRERILADLQTRVEELEGNLAEAREQQRELDTRGREEKQRADESLVEALAGKRRAEDAFSAACQSELEMRCRLESALQQVEEAEAARDELAAEAFTSSQSREEEAKALAGRLQAAENKAASMASLADRAEAAAAEDADAARRKLLAHEAALAGKDKTIAELNVLVESLKPSASDVETKASGVEEQAGARAVLLAEQAERMLADTRRAQSEAAAARAENKSLSARIEELTRELSAASGEGGAAARARDELQVVNEAVASAEAQVFHFTSRVVEEAMSPSEQLAAAQLQLKVKADDAARCEEEARCLRAQLQAVKDAAAEREAADACRIAEAESQLEEATARLSAATAEAAAATSAAATTADGSPTKKGAADVDEMLAEVESKLTAANEQLTSLKDDAAEKEAALSARIAELEGELEFVTESLAATRAAAEDKEATLTESEGVLRCRTADLESELEAVNSSFASARTSAEEKEASFTATEEVLRSRVAELERELAAVNESFASVTRDAEAVFVDRERMLRSRIDELESELDVVNESLDSTKVSMQDKEAALVESESALRSRIAELESELEVVEGSLASAKTAAKENEAALAENQGVFHSRVADLESELKVVNESLASAAAAMGDKEAFSKKTEEVLRSRIAELEGELELVNDSLASAQVAVRDKDAALSETEKALRARVADLESEIEVIKESLASAEAVIENKEAALLETKKVLHSRIADLESELEAVNESLASAKVAVEDEEAALLKSQEVLRSRISDLEIELQSVNESLASAVAAAEDRDASSKETEAGFRSHVAELEVDLRVAKESLASAEAAAEDREAALSEAEGRLQAALGQVNELSSAAEEKAALEEKAAAEIDLLRQEMSAAATKHDAEMSEAREAMASALDVQIEEAAAEATTRLEAEIAEARGELESTREALATKALEVDSLVEQARDAQEAAAASAEIVAQRDASIATMRATVEGAEGIEGELAQALEDSESLSRELLDLTDQLTKKDAELVELREQVKARTAELHEAQAASPSAAATPAAAAAATANPDGFDGEMAESSSEQRRLRVELDQKGSELDTAIKEKESIRAELKEVRNMLGAAANAAGVAGADEDSLRKRVSQLACENGLLRGERDRVEALAAKAEAESRASVSRAAAETERLEREVERLSAVVTRSSGAAEDGDRMRAALSAMEARLSELRHERAELQEARQRSLDRCSEAEGEVETLRTRIAELEGQGSGRDAVIALEIKVDNLEQELRRAAASKAAIEGDARETANRAKRLQGEVEMMRSEYEVVSEEASGLRGRLAAAEAKLEEDQAAESGMSSGDRSEELEAEIARLQEALCDLEEAHLQSLHKEQDDRVKLQAEHDAAVAALEEKVTESLELAEQIEADRDQVLDELRAKLTKDHGEKLAAMQARLEKAAQAFESKQAVVNDLSDECRKLKSELGRAGEEARSASAELEERLRTAEEARDGAEERLTETLRAGKATEEQLRHRLTAQVAEAENLRQELMDTRERSDRAEAAVRASEQRAREGADDKTKKLLVEMEHLCQEKLIAEHKAGDMEAELERLREEVATAEQTAAKEQGMLIRATEERMAVFNKEKDIAMAELKASLEAVHASASTETAAAEVEKATAALNDKVAALTATTVEYQETIKRQDARIKKLEQVRLTNGQVEKLKAMKDSAKKTAVENAELKQQLSALEERLAAQGGGGRGGPSAEEAAAVATALAAAMERNKELQGAKDTVMEKLREYGKKVYDLEKEQTRVRAAVVELGGSVPDGVDLGDAVLDCAHRFVGGDRGGDGSMLSTGSHDEAAVAETAAAEAAADELRRELGETREALRKAEASRTVLKEQMIAGVAKFRALEEQEKAARERFELVEEEQRSAVSAVLKTKEKEHERKLKFLQEENVQLFSEITACKAKADQYKAELKLLREKLAAMQVSLQPPASAGPKRALGDRTNSSPAKVAKFAGKPAISAAAAPTSPKVQPAAAAERRAASRALIDGDGSVNDEGAGECNQS